VLHVTTADRPQPLAAALADVLRVPPPDPFTPDWVAVPTEGLRRWLQLELARTLGAGSPRTHDGVAANIDMPSPGALAERVLDAGRPPDRTDPWRVDHLAWAVLDVVAAHRDDDRLGPAVRLPEGGTWFGRARRLADLFDRYSAHRPEMVRAWSNGVDVGPAPTSGDDALAPVLDPAHRWQPHLWRLVRRRIGEPSPPERWPEMLAGLRAGRVAVDLPDRIALFGLTTLPGGEPFLELVDAIGATRHVHLFLLDPSPVATTKVREAILAGGTEPDDTTGHPLVRSWGRPHRDATVLLSRAERRGLQPVTARAGAPSPTDEQTAPARLLARLQADIRADRPPVCDRTLDPADRSVQVHACHGPARQVEVLRDAILHLLADDPTLREDDVVVLCPSITDYAPLIEATFGPPADRPTPTGDTDGDTAGRSTDGRGRPAAGAPRLAYRISDRSRRDAPPLLAAMSALLDLLAGRFAASEVIDFVALPPVRARYGLDDDAIGTISTWIGEANVRWGLDAEHRERWSVPAALEVNTWRSGLDRVLMGVAVSDDDLDLTSGGIAPLGVEGSDVAVAGALADIVARLANLADEASRDRPIGEWCELLVEAAEALFDPGLDGAWEWRWWRRILADVVDEAVVSDKPSEVALTSNDLRRVLDARLHGGTGRSAFFRGGVTFTSLQPLRWVPFRVVCLLGLDEGTLAATPVDGDDLTVLAPRPGDRDPRAEARQALLEAVLAAGDALVVTRTGRNVRTNHEVPPSVVVAELRDTVVGMLDAPAHDGEALIERAHPRQAFDERNFRTGDGTGDGVSARPWSFDGQALAGAEARRARRQPHVPGPQHFLAEPLPVHHDEEVIALADLKGFLTDPVKHFLRNRLRLRLPRDDEPVADDFALGLVELRGWAASDRLLRARIDGRTRHEWERHERALGTVPPGSLGDAALDKLARRVDALLDELDRLELDPSASEPVEVDVELSDGTRVVGVVECADGTPPGPLTVTCSSVSPKHDVDGWLDLAALSAQRPDTPWRAVVVRRKDEGADALELLTRASDPHERHRRALEALEVAVDCYRRGSCEPLPLFKKLSRTLYEQRPKSSAWRSHMGYGDGDDDSQVLVFGDVDLFELRSLPARADDPPGEHPGRADRFAGYLWSAVERFVQVRDPDDGDREDR
jgi:exodeoxyribonuclease V gamma subunit